MFRKLLLLIVALLSVLAAADEGWTHADILLASDDQLKITDLKAWLKTQPHIKKVYRDDIKSPKLQVYKTSSTGTSFIEVIVSEILAESLTPSAEAVTSNGLK